MASNNTFTSFNAKLNLAAPSKKENGEHINYSARIVGAYSRSINVSEDLYNHICEKLNYLGADSSDFDVTIYASYVDSSKCDSPFISLYAK